MKKLIISIALIHWMIAIVAQNCDTNLFPGGDPYWDTYHPIINDLDNWKHYNTHDPTVNKDGEWFYMYSTDASWANLHHTGALKRRSRDLVNWEFLGDAFDGIPQSAADFFLTINPDYTDDGIWAPYLLKYKDKYILYYSAPGGLSGVNLAYIGYAYSDSAGGPWEDQGMITTSTPGDTINAIDPTVIYDSLNHQLWMAYGSWHRGLYVVELDTATGGLKNPGDRGVKIAARPPGYGLEAPELTYRNGWYYLFTSYDPLGDVYNVRVGRSRNPNGPFYDFNGVDMAEPSSNIPMIEAPYQFNNHPGWQGTGHCGVYNDNGEYYMFNQGRPSIEPAMMVLHVRKVFWMDDWPIVSPERYAGVPSCEITADTLAGVWEHLPLIYKSSGAYHSKSEELLLHGDGTFNDNAANTWTFADDTLRLSWSNGDMQKLIVFWGWDWENDCRTLLYTGMDTEGLCIWGKKVNQEAVDNYTLLVPGASYHITNLHSQMLLTVPGQEATPLASVIQKKPNGRTNQVWKIKETETARYYYMFPGSSPDSIAMEVRNGSTANYADIIVNPFDGSNKQEFFIYYNDDGYFRIYTKNSNLSSCLEVFGFSIQDGGNVDQWEYEGGLNQLWRFNRIDSIPIDTVSVDTFTVENIELTERSSLTIYPNPSTDGKITIDLSSVHTAGSIDISVFDIRGVPVFSEKTDKLSADKMVLELPKGLFIIQVNTNSQQYVRKLIVQ